MAFDIDSLLIKKVRRVVFTDTDTGEVFFNATEIENPSLNITADSTEKTDAMGSPIATFYNGDSAEFSAESSVFSMNILATQFGDTLHQASSTNKYISPCFEELVVGKDSSGVANKTITLKHIPVGETGAEVPVIYIINKNKAMGTKFVVGTTASDTEFEINAATKTITLPTSTEITATTRIFVEYRYEAEKAVYTEKVSGAEPKSGRATCEVMFCDPCNKNIEYFGYVVFGNAQLSPEVDITFDTESTHPFSFTCAKDWCDSDGKLLYVIVPNDD